MSIRNRYQSIQNNLLQNPKVWLITGVAGFIGSNLLEKLLKLKQKVIGIDNFSTGHQENLDEVQKIVRNQQWENFTFILSDIRNLKDCKNACRGVDYVLHQAALGSVPRSLVDPINTNDNNVSGFLNMLVTARDANVKRFVYAASSSTYGDHPDLPKKEDIIGRPLSPYAVTKYVNELYADVFHRAYGLKCVGLRYFNVFGPRQDPQGAYAAVIPQWFSALLRGAPLYINGDGKTSRDFCYIDNCVQANILAAMATTEALGQVYNVACGETTTLNSLFKLIKDRVGEKAPELAKTEAIYREFRQGDVRHSLADISKAKYYLGYKPQDLLLSGLSKASKWYFENL